MTVDIIAEMSLLALAASALWAVSTAAPAGDVITSFPGFGPPLSDAWSGYLDIPDGKHLHYVAYASQGDPAVDPVVFWFNGGPGCSSMEGGFQESGPLWTAPGGATLQTNAFTWNRFSTQVFLEAPAGVGFSYADEPSGTVHNDTGTARDNLAAVLAFYIKFPEYTTLPLWLSGESYAGVYIPMLAHDIYKYNLAAPPATNALIPLRGLLVGNGCIGRGAGVCSDTGFGNYLSLKQFHGHGFISDVSYDAAVAVCGDWSNESAACAAAVDQATHEVGTLVDIYDIYSGMWGECNYGAMRKAHRRPIAASSVLGKIVLKVEAAFRAGALINNCTNDDDMETYFNRADFQAAMHVKTKTWKDCGGITYNSDMEDERTTIYPTLVEKAGIEIVIFNGEADACVVSGSQRAQV